MKCLVTLVLAAVLILDSPSVAPAKAATAVPAGGMDTEYDVVALESQPDATWTTATGIDRHGRIVGYEFRLVPGNFTRRSILWQGGRRIDLGFVALNALNPGPQINSGGDVAGTHGAGLTPHAHFWTQGRSIDLGTLPGDDYSTALALNDRGQVLVLSGYDAMGPPGDQQRRGFLWKDGRTTELDFRPVAGGLNDRGQVIGIRPSNKVDPTGFYTPTDAVLWQDGKERRLGDLGGVQTVPTAINARGDVIGWGVTASYEFHAFVWRDGVMTDLGAGPGSGYTAPVAINDRGDALISYQIGVGPLRGSLSRERETIDLGSFAPAAMNNRGQVVGSLEGSPHAALWEDGRVIELPNLPGGSQASARAIDDHGNIVGIGTDAKGKRVALHWAPRPGRAQAHADVAPASAPTLACAATVSGAGLRVQLTLADERPARLSVFDVRGRALLARELGAPGAGKHVLDFRDSGISRSGVYFVTLDQGGRRATGRVVLLD